MVAFGAYAHPTLLQIASSFSLIHRNPVVHHLEQ
jgi:hypothetical protein